MAWVVFLGVIILLVLFFVSIYNKLIVMIEAVRNNEKQIDIQLDRRFKVFESLINVVKNYMDYEKSTLKEVVALRSQAQQAKGAGDADARMAAENKISSLASGISLVFEQYPDLKANQNALQLQEEIVSTENKLAYAKQAMNDSIERYNAYKRAIPALWVVSTCSASLDHSFPYWQLSKSAVAEKESYTVKL